MYAHTHECYVGVPTVHLSTHHITRKGPSLLLITPQASRPEEGGRRGEGDANPGNELRKRTETIADIFVVIRNTFEKQVRELAGMEKHKTDK